MTGKQNHSFDAWWDSHLNDFLEQYSIVGFAAMKALIRDRIDAELAQQTALLRRWATKPDSDDGVELLRETLEAIKEKP